MDMATVTNDWSLILLPIIAAVGSVVAAFATAIIAYLAIKQLPILIQQLESAKQDRIIAAELEKERRTVDVCTYFSTDYALYCVKKSIYEQRDPDKPRSFVDPKKVARDVRHLLNYFDCIAIGIRQGIYDQDIVFDNLNLIIIDAVEQFVYTEPPGRFVEKNNYPHLVNLYTDFKNDFEKHLKAREELFKGLAEVREKQLARLAAGTHFSKDKAKE